MRSGRGTFPLPPPIPPGTFLPARLRGAQKDSPFPRMLPSVFSTPRSLPKGVILMTRRSLFSQGLSGRCVSVSTPLEGTNGIFKSPIPRALSHSTGPPLPDPAARVREGARQTLAAGRPRRGEPRHPNPGHGGWVLQRSLDRFREKETEIKEQEQGVRCRRAKEQNSLRHGRWGRPWLSSAGQRPGTAPRAGAPASDFRGGSFCLPCRRRRRRRRRSCGCRGS